MVVVLVMFEFFFANKKKVFFIWENQLYILCAKIITRYINAMTVKLYEKEPLKLCLNNYLCTHVGVVKF